VKTGNYQQSTLLIETITEDFGFNSTSLLCTYITNLRSNSDYSMLLQGYTARYVNCESRDGRSESMLSLLSLAVIRDNTFQRTLLHTVIDINQSTRNVVSVVFGLCKLKPSLFAYLFIMPKRHINIETKTNSWQLKRSNIHKMVNSNRRHSGCIHACCLRYFCMRSFPSVCLFCVCF